MNRKYLPTFAELIDRMSICQLKAIFIPENKEAYDQEIADIQHDLDQIIEEKNIKLSSEMLKATSIFKANALYKRSKKFSKERYLQRAWRES